MKASLGDRITIEDRRDVPSLDCEVLATGPDGDSPHMATAPVRHQADTNRTAVIASPPDEDQPPPTTDSTTSARDIRPAVQAADYPASTRHVDAVVESLQARFSSAEPEFIRALVEAEFASYSDARVRDFIPVLVEASVRTRLRQATLRSTTTDGGKPP